tara:strand:+ start:1050 stop:1736 length:687 start_codon:yes stop_codon:yes gene_type:complete
MQVNNLIKSMLLENTGKHFLDSGGVNGRHYQWNQGVIFEDLKPVEVEVYGENSIDITINLYHYLVNANLELDLICVEFNSLQKSSDNWNADSLLGECYGVSKEAEDFLEGSCLQGELLYDVKVESTWNTYNGDSFLSQVLQGSYLTINGESYVLFQIHGGSDVRGGYTDAKLFKLDSFQEWLPCENVIGAVDGVSVDNMYDGYNLTDEDGNAVKLNKDSVIELELLGA